MRELELDVLLLAANDYRGHKGALRWVGDYNLAPPLRLRGRPARRRARAAPAAEPGSRAAPAAGTSPSATRGTLSAGIPERLRELGPLRRIGVVGLAEVMKVADYLALREAFPRGRAGRRPAGVRARARPEEPGGAGGAARERPHLRRVLRAAARARAAGRLASASSARRCTSAATRSAARTRCSSRCTPSPPATARWAASSGRPPTACCSPATCTSSRSSRSARSATGSSSRA